MRVKITNPNNIVTGAVVASNPHGIQLIINTYERWIMPDRTAHTENDAIAFEFDMGSTSDVVTVTPETETENKLLKQVRYQNHEKDQLTILFMDPELLVFSNHQTHN